MFFIVLAARVGAVRGIAMDPSIRPSTGNSESVMIRDVYSGPTVSSRIEREEGRGGEEQKRGTLLPGAVGTGVGGKSEKRVPLRTDAGVQINLPKLSRQVAASR